MEFEKGMLYGTIFGTSCEIISRGIAPRFGAYETIQFDVRCDGKELTSIFVKLSSTVIALWKITDEELMDVLFDLGMLKIRIMLENEELHAGVKEILFNSYAVPPSAAEEIGKLQKELDSNRSLHQEWQKMIANSSIRNRELITQITKSHVDFQSSNSREIRSTLLQVVSVSAVIIAGVIALGKDSVSNDILLTCSLVFFAAVVVMGFHHILTVLENSGLSVFNSYQKMIKKLEDISEKEWKFLKKPSIQGYKSLLELWEVNLNEIKDRDKISKLDKDRTLAIVQWLFILAIILILTSLLAKRISWIL